MANENVTVLSKPRILGGEYTYNGDIIMVEIEGFDSDTMTVSGTQRASRVGTYTVTFSLRDRSSYMWDDNTTDSFTDTWRIEKAVVDIPKLTNAEFTYDGATHSPEVSGYNSQIISVSGDTTAAKAGEYSITYALKDRDSYSWEDGSTDDITVYWSIIGQETSDSPTPRVVSFEQLGIIKNYIDDKTEIDYATSEEVKTLFGMK
ncbi:MAG: hypothetical protein NC299_18060 [Lachnospiraceae bacterium]|nr:hypothetical protein [Lachnospiraceae bacterium]